MKRMGAQSTLLEKLIVSQFVKKFPRFKESEYCLPGSLVPAIGDESIIYPPILLLF
jgi:hypothetical protein